jgi:hypothetical protein
VLVEDLGDGYAGFCLVTGRFRPNIRVVNKTAREVYHLT